MCTLSNPPPVGTGQEPIGNITLQCWVPGNPALKEVGLLAFKEVGLCKRTFLPDYTLTLD